MVALDFPHVLWCRMINFSDANGEKGKSGHHPNLPNSTPLIRNSRFSSSLSFPILHTHAHEQLVDRLILTGRQVTMPFSTIFIRKTNYLERPPTRSPSDVGNPGSIRLTKLYLAPSSSARKLRVLESLSKTINGVKEALDLSTISAVTGT